MKKTLADLILFVSLLFFAATSSGCAALWITGAAVAGVTALDLATRQECSNCKKIIPRGSPTCPYCGKANPSAKAKTPEAKKK